MLLVHAHRLIEQQVHYMYNACQYVLTKQRRHINKLKYGDKFIAVAVRRLYDTTQMLKVSSEMFGYMLIQENYACTNITINMYIYKVTYDCLAKITPR